MSTTEPADRGASAAAPGNEPGRRLVVVGASAGGVEALTRLVGRLPAEFPTPICVVLHVPTSSDSRLPEILSRAGPLRAIHARDGERLRPGVIHVAPPNRHLLVRNDRLALVDGPRENGVRPAVDPLFRSAARSFTNGVVAIVLSGTLDDGTAGAAAVRAAGGITVAQDPSDALAPGMPTSVIEAGLVDVVVAADAMGSIVDELVRTAPGPRPVGALESTPSESTDLVCPECGGSLRAFDEYGVFRFHCRVGHDYSAESLYAAQDARLEAALWTAIRTLEESASMSHRLAERARERGTLGAAARFESRELDAARRAEQVRAAILSLTELDATPTIGEPQPVAAEDDLRRPTADHWPDPDTAPGRPRSRAEPAPASRGD